MSNTSILLIRWTDRWLWRRKAFRHVTVKCPARTGKGKGLAPQRRICIFQRILRLISISTCILRVQELWASTATLPIHCRPPLPSTATPACPTHTTHQLLSYPAWCDGNWTEVWVHGKLEEVVQNTHNSPTMCSDTQQKHNWKLDQCRCIKKHVWIKAHIIAECQCVLYKTSNHVHLF